MFLKFLNFGRKTENDNAGLRRAKPRTGESEKAGTGNCVDQSSKAGQEELAPVVRTSSGRDSLSRLKMVARGQRAHEQTQSRWFAKPEAVRREAAEAAAAAAMAVTDEEKNENCPSVPEADRMKAIEDLLGMGVNHFSVKHEE